MFVCVCRFSCAVHVCVQLGQRSAYQVEPALWPVDLDKEQSNGQVGDLPSPSFRNRPPCGTLWPGGDVSLVGLIKLHVLPTDQQSLRIIVLERDGFPTQSMRGKLRRPATQRLSL